MKIISDQQYHMLPDIEQKVTPGGHYQKTQLCLITQETYATCSGETGIMSQGTSVRFYLLSSLDQYDQYTLCIQPSGMLTIERQAGDN